MELWDANEKGETWEYIYFIDSLQSIDIPYVQFNQTVGYQSNFVPQGFMVLNEERSSSYFDEHEIQITQTQYAALATALNELESFDKPGSVLNRVEQGILRRIHIGDNLNRTCGMCDRSLPASLLVAAHIKKRAECTQDDKRDVYNIAMPMCALGCDPLFEKGYISVQDGVIVVSKASQSSGTELVKVLNILEGKICGSWNENNKKYFAWHMKNTFKD